MMPNFHPNQEDLIEFASGSLSKHHPILISCHLRICEQCRMEHSKMKSISAVILDSAEPVEADLQSLKSSLLNEIDSLETESKSTKISQESATSILDALFHVNLKSIHWRWISPGVRAHLLEKQKEKYNLVLVKAKEGVRTLHLQYEGKAFAVILEGNIVAQDCEYKAGDVEDLNEIQHEQDIGSTKETSTHLTMLEKRPRIKGLAGIFNPILRKVFEGI